MFSIKSFAFADSDFYHIALQIRRTVFIEEQHVPENLELENEDNATSYLIFDNGNPVGTGRWRRTNHGIKLERFAILPHYRNKGIGSILLKHVLDDLKDEPLTIYLHSQLRAVPYYQRHGFEILGKMFVEAGINHFKMIYTIK
jgi:predicted GNAT family N-acyltransferase